MNEETIISDIKNKLSDDLEKYLKCLNLNELLKLKQISIDDQTKIRLLEEKNKKLIEEMNNFKKVSLLNTMTNQLHENNKEIINLKQIIKNKDNTIFQLKQKIETIEKKKNELTVFNDNNNFQINQDIKSDKQIAVDKTINSYDKEVKKDINILNRQIENSDKYSDTRTVVSEDNNNFKIKRLKGKNYYFIENKLFSILEDNSKGEEVGFFLEDKKKFKFY